MEPTAKSKSHMYLVIEKHPLVSGILNLTRCVDLWALGSVCRWCLLVNMYGGIRALLLNWPGQLSIAAWGHELAGDSAVFYFPLIDKAQPQVFNHSRTDTHRAYLFDLTWTRTHRGATVLSVVSHYRAAGAFTLSVQLWLYLCLCLSLFAVSQCPTYFLMLCSLL